MNKFLLFSLAVFIFAVNGCGGAVNKGTGSPIREELKGAPNWVLNGYGDSDKKVYGVGSVTGTGNVALARSTAQARGRDEIARSLKLEVASMLKDYQATTTGGSEFGADVWDEQKIVNVSEQIVEPMKLDGTRQEDTWISDTGTLYVLMSLDLEYFKNSLENTDVLPEEARKAVSERAEKAFAELDEKVGNN